MQVGFPLKENIAPQQRQVNAKASRRPPLHPAKKLATAKVNSIEGLSPSDQAQYIKNQKRLQALNASNARLEAKASEQRVQIAELVARTKQKDAQIADLMTGMKALKSDNAKKDAQIAKRDAQIEQLTSEVTQLKDMFKQFMKQKGQRK